MNPKKTKIGTFTGVRNHPKILEFPRLLALADELKKLETLGSLKLQSVFKFSAGEKISDASSCFEVGRSLEKREFNVLMPSVLEKHRRQGTPPVTLALTFSRRGQWNGVGGWHGVFLAESIYPDAKSFTMVRWGWAPVRKIPFWPVNTSTTMAPKDFDLETVLGALRQTGSVVWDRVKKCGYMSPAKKKREEAA